MFQWDYKKSLFIPVSNILNLFEISRIQEHYFIYIQLSV